MLMVGLDPHCLSTTKQPDSFLWSAHSYLLLECKMKWEMPPQLFRLGQVTTGLFIKQ